MSDVSTYWYYACIEVLIVSNDTILFALVFVSLFYNVTSIVDVTNYTYDVDEGLTCLKE